MLFYKNSIMRKAIIIPPTRPDGIDVLYTVMVQCGKKQIEHSVRVEYDKDHENPLLYNRQCINAGAQEALPRGYDQYEIQGDVELAANDWSPWSFVLSPVEEKPASNPS